MSKKRRRQFDPWRDRWPVLLRVLEALENGQSLRRAAAAAGIAVSTLCRWQDRSRSVAGALAFATRVGTLAKRRQELAASAAHGLRLGYFQRRPMVKRRDDCPSCGAPLEMRPARRRFAPVFWRCSRYPDCRFASWRPRAPHDCPVCQSPRFWACSRKSISCPRCGLRVVPAVGIGSTQDVQQLHQGKKR